MLSPRANLLEKKSGASILYQNVFRTVDQEILFLTIYNGELVEEKQMILPRKTSNVTYNNEYCKSPK